MEMSPSDLTSRPWQTLAVQVADGVCRVRLGGREGGGTITAGLVAELGAVVAVCADMAARPAITVLVLEGTPTVFCAGGDLAGASGQDQADDPAPLYDLWTRLSTGPFVSIALVQGKATAGGVGFAAACDVVLAARSASFQLPELLFGLYPACVLPFLARRVGMQRAHQLALGTRTIDAAEALAWGLADAVEADAEALLRSHLVRLRRLGKPALARYKAYAAGVADTIERCRPAALAANREMFADPDVRANIARYVTELKFPWEP
ncbi:enoyl-CoA hydratase/isomerase [Azorhizobium doebereinerae]|uniref:enoyl-CoA hydratase/isomerase n=1 Tax=Azorhizobium doebereinerae TaxID=281091 RepID=UPI0003F619DB|nr:enoyl-CoA hydratase/isomerase [Azorhizobium doebereinerae]